MNCMCNWGGLGEEDEKEKCRMVMELLPSGWRGNSLRCLELPLDTGFCSAGHGEHTCLRATLELVRVAAWRDTPFAPRILAGVTALCLTCLPQSHPNYNMSPGGEV